MVAFALLSLLACSARGEAVSLSSGGAGTYWHEALVVEAAGAENLVAECRLDEAFDALVRLRDQIGPLRGDPRQRELALWTWSRRKEVRRLKKELEGLSKDAAAVLEGRAQGAGAAADAFIRLSALPPGCGRLAGLSRPIEEELREAVRARRDPSALERFALSVRSGRELAADCRPSEAGRSLALALAVLDAGPGKAAAPWDYGRVRAALPIALAQEALRGPLEAETRSASAVLDAGYAGAAAVALARLSVGMRRLYGSCRPETLKKTEALAEKAGEAIRWVKQELPPDPTRAEAAAVSAERARLGELRVLSSDRKAESEAPIVPKRER